MSSTKIADLPDNKETSSNILNDLNDDVSVISENEPVVSISESTPLPPSSSSFIDYDELINSLKDASLVFILVFILTNSSIISLLAKLPYISSLEPHSIIYNGIISLVISIVYLVIKYSLNVL